MKDAQCNECGKPAVSASREVIERMPRDNEDPTCRYYLPGDVSYWCAEHEPQRYGRSPLTAAVSSLDFQDAVERQRQAILSAFRLPADMVTIASAAPDAKVTCTLSQPCPTGCGRAAMEPDEYGGLPMTCGSDVCETKVSEILKLETIGELPACPTCKDAREITLFTGTSPCPDCAE